MHSSIFSIRHVTIATRRLRLFGQIARADPAEDHARALSACVDHPAKDGKRHQGRPRHTWLRTVEQDLRRDHLRLWTAVQRAQNRVQSVAASGGDSYATSLLPDDDDVTCPEN